MLSALESAERIRNRTGLEARRSERPCGALVGDAHRQRTNLLSLTECERSWLPKYFELLVCFLDAALSVDLIWRCHSRPHASTPPTAARAAEKP